MLNLIHLPCVPSGFESLAWSADGDLAVAAGEYVQILTLKRPNRDSSGPLNKDEWNITRLRVNLFTQAEWQNIQPQNRDDFSVGVEQSTSNVVGIAWSPPGLARFRRSVLAVLTSNLLLSLWEFAGMPGQWNRVAVINHAFHLDPKAPEPLSGLELRRSNIRSFHWCPPLHIPPQNQGLAPEAESRWGIHLLMVTNDANEAILLRIRRTAHEKGLSMPYSVEKLALHSLQDEKQLYPQVCSSSLLQRALQIKARALSASCGPWLETARTSDEDLFSVTAMIAVTLGSKLRTFKAVVTLQESSLGQGGFTSMPVSARLSDHSTSQMVSDSTTRPVNGPIRWISTTSSTTIILTAATNASLLTVPLPRDLYLDNPANEVKLNIEERLFSSFVEEDGERPRRYMMPVSEIISLLDEAGETANIHVGNAGGLGATFQVNGEEISRTPQTPSWNHFMRDSLEQFDLDRDLGGQSIARVWGLASFRDVVAVLFSRHPTDMIEYRVASDERSTIAFASETSNHSDDIHALLAPSASATRSWSPKDQREAVISYVLSSLDSEAENDLETQRLVYASACCAIVDQEGKAIREHARLSLEKLAALTGADLSEEVAKCNAEPAAVSAKTTAQLNGPGIHLFERCEICDAGISWTSADDAQCDEGHLFGLFPGLF
ncbi:Uncharacterized protein PECH_005566 [Penicillium ucsense]|uniref:Transcription factor IIIC 90kDa subunit N-terminal domain-containing protein n=1 Tax=Penicillium ucsense TaxID=2839758 RepID=A0A8J8W0Q9_9EURO|nr:Uncharacterized protein PECM_007276 [Penicillium ucsense]KAF7739169.1 Uncharacterized protein PECH_005566 [Penicillium ucsense]